MSIAIITGSAGLIGSEATRYFASQGMTVIGIDNDMRREFFGEEASTRWQVQATMKTSTPGCHTVIESDMPLACHHREITGFRKDLSNRDAFII